MCNEAFPCLLSCLPRPGFQGSPPARTRVRLVKKTPTGGDGQNRDEAVGIRSCGCTKHRCTHHRDVVWCSLSYILRAVRTNSTDKGYIASYQPVTATPPHLRFVPLPNLWRPRGLPAEQTEYETTSATTTAPVDLHYGAPSGRGVLLLALAWFPFRSATLRVEFPKNAWPANQQESQQETIS